MSSAPVAAPAPATAVARTRAVRAAARRAWGLVLAGAVVPVLLICGVGLFAAVKSRAQFEQRAELLTQNLAIAIDQSLSADIGQVDLALTAIVNHLEMQAADGPLDRRAANAHIRAQVNHRPELDSIRVTDAAGAVILGAGAESNPALSFADREWFVAHRDDPGSGLIVSKPLVSKAAGHWILSFSRRYRGRDGAFAGAVTAAIPLPYFAKELAAIDVGPHGTVVLRDSQLGLILRHPTPAVFAAGAVGSRTASTEFQALYNAGAAQGTVHVPAMADAVERTMSFRRLRGAQMVVIVGLGTEDYLADWRAEVRMVAAFCVGVLALYAAGAWLNFRMLRQNRQARQRIDLLAKVFEHSGEAILMTDADNRILEVNPAFERLMGYTAEEVLGRNPRMFASGRTTPAEYAALWQALESGGQWRGEIWDRTKDGREFPQWMSISVARDEDGRVLHHIASAIDMSEMKEAERRILHLAHHDTLTLLPNRVHLQGRLEQAIAVARRERSGLAMLFIDMDRFKNINDTLGHHIGDGLLVEVGQRLRGIVRESDIVARLGGDEFVLVLTGLAEDKAAATRVAAGIADKVMGLLGRPYVVEGHDLHSTPSIGIGFFPADGEDVDTLMKNADTAMYHAKSAGRNNFQCFTPAMNRATTERLALEVGLRTAIARGELFLQYQPQLDLATRRVVGMEALVRWRHPERGLIPPLAFIGVAEDTGQIEAIGAWVLETALAQVARWRAAGRGDLRVAVNLSVEQLRGDALAGHVAQALRRHGLAGDALELELTESSAMRDPARTAELLRELRTMGVALAIDDFGTGYSSLAYLKQLPLSCLKLDRSFVSDLENDTNDAAICRATIQLAHSLGLAVVAEGVETAAQLEFLGGLGCDMIQGYFISRPLDAADCGAFVAPETPPVAAPAGRIAEVEADGVTGR